MEQTKEKIAIMKDVVKDKSPLAMAMLEDEAVRLGAEKAARDHLNQVYEHNDGMPFWMWAMLWFVVGMLFDITVTDLGMHLWKFTGGCGS
jgi:hypothetical protein